MAKNPSELNRKVLQHLRTTLGAEAIGPHGLANGRLKDVAAEGEIIVQLGDAGSGNTGTSLWTLASDKDTAVRFVNQAYVDGKVLEIQEATGHETERVNNIIAAVGLANNGTMPASAFTNTNYLSGETTVINALKELDKNIKRIDDAVLDDLNVNSVNADPDKILVDLEQHGGLIGSADTKHVGEFSINGYTEGADAKLAATDTLNAALGKLQGQINAMDKEADAVEGKVVTTVAEADGKVTETKANLTDIKLNGYNGDHGTVTSADTLGGAIDKIEDEIAAAVSAVTVTSADKSINVTTSTTGTNIEVNIKSDEKVLKKDGNNGLYTDLDLVKITTGLPETIKERYQLLASDDTQIGANIDVPKDSHIVSINYITDPADAHYQNLEYVYIDASGATQTTYVDMSKLVLEAEFASGVTVTDGIAHGVVDPQSEKFLTVGADGFKLAGVQNAIDAAMASGKTQINTTVGGDSNTHMTITSGTAADGHTVYEFALNDVASADELAALSGSVLDLDATVSDKKPHIGVTIVETDGKLTSVTLTENDIASASALTTEVNRAKAAEKAIDDKIGSHTGESESKYDVEFSAPNNTVADKISNILKEIDAAKEALEVKVVDDDKYIATKVDANESGTIIGISAITHDIATSTSGSSALVDSWDAKAYLVHELVDNTANANDFNVTRVAATANNGVVYDFTNLVVDCGEFGAQ